MPTIGAVVSSSHQGVPLLNVVVTGPGGAVIALDVTDDSGLFWLSLPDIEGMEISVLDTPLVGIPVTAGEHMVLVLP